MSGKVETGKAGEDIPYLRVSNIRGWFLNLRGVKEEMHQDRLYVARVDFVHAGSAFLKKPMKRGHLVEEVAKIEKQYRDTAVKVYFQECINGGAKK